MMEHHKEDMDGYGGYKPDNGGSGSGWFDWMGDWGMGGSNDHDDDDYYGGGSGDDYYGSGDNMDMDYDGGDSWFMDGFYEFLEFLGTEGETQLKFMVC